MTNGRSVSVNGASFWVEEAGDGPPMVLVHSGVSDMRMWDAQFAAFGERFRVVRYDLRGFGQSSMPAGDFAHHDDLVALMAALGVDTAVVVSASMGGEVALAAALEHPDRVQGVVAANTLVGMREPSALLRKGWKATKEAMVAGDLDRAVEIELEMWVDGPHRRPDEVDPAVRKRVREMDRALLERANEHDQGSEREADPPVIERLEDVACPVLVVTGTLDVDDAMVSAAELLARIPNARRVDIEKAAHLPSMEQPDVFNDGVLAFVEQLSMP